MKLTEGNNKFCGPAALSVVSGCSVDHCAYVIGSIIGKAPDKVKSVYTSDWLKAAEKMRIKTTKVNAYGQSLFGQIHYLINTPGVYLVALTDHFVVVEITHDGNEKQAYLCDNHTKVPIKAEASARLSQAVVEVYKCEIKAPPVLIRESIKVEQTENGQSIYYDIYLAKEFSDESDNHTIKLGYLSCTNKQLSQVISQLLELQMKYNLKE